MARPKKTKRSSYKLRASDLNVERGSSSNKQSFFDKIQSDLEDRQSLVSLVLGGLIIIIVGILLYNYFNKPQGDLGPSQQIDQEATTGDVAKEDLPGKYTVKENDTLFSIALHYYDDGYKYEAIVNANNLKDPNAIEAGQVLEIPKLEEESVMLPQESASPSPSLNDGAQVIEPQATAQVMEDGAKGGAENQTIWGESITDGKYTVVEGDWLSTIAGRAYGNIYAYEKIAKANNIANPDLIEPGMVLKIPR